MKEINNYSPFVLNTFSTTVFGKEHLVNIQNGDYLIVPAYNLGIEMDSAIYLEKSFLIFKKIFKYSAEHTPYSINKQIELDYSSNLKYNFEILDGENEGSGFQMEGLSFRHKLEYYSSFDIFASSCKLIYNKEILLKNIGARDIKYLNNEMSFFHDMYHEDFLEYIN